MVLQEAQGNNDDKWKSAYADEAQGREKRRADKLTRDKQWQGMPSASIAFGIDLLLIGHSPCQYLQMLLINLFSKKKQTRSGEKLNPNNLEFLKSSTI